MNQREALRRLRTADVGILATADAAGRPHLVPFVFAVRANQIVSAVDHKPKQSSSLARLRNIAGDPRVSVLAHHYDDDWTELWWVRADGQATVTDEPPAALRDALTAKYPQYHETPPQGPWIVIEIERSVGWAAAP